MIVLGLALNQKAELDHVLLWTENVWVKCVEFGLVFLLALHLFGGLRVMALELLGWHERQKTLTAAALSGAFFLACLFLMRAL